MISNETKKQLQEQCVQSIKAYSLQDQVSNGITDDFYMLFVTKPWFIAERLKMPAIKSHVLTKSIVADHLIKHEKFGVLVEFTSAVSVGFSTVESKDYFYGEDASEACEKFLEFTNDVENRL